MNPIERLRDDLAARFPGLVLEIDVPADEVGVWHLDVRPGGGSPWVVVEWESDRGFGVSTPGADDYGLKPDELYPNAKAAYGRVVRLILSGSRTDPSAAVRLAELRSICGLSQAEVAGRAGVKQAAIARIEGRGDILLSTLHRVIAAMGGTLSIRARFPDGTERELTGLGSPPEDIRGCEGPVAKRGRRAAANAPDLTGVRAGHPAEGPGKSAGRAARKAAGKGKPPRR